MEFLFESTDEKINFLEKLAMETRLNNEIWNAIVNLSNDNDYEVRLYVAEILSNFLNEQSELLLVRLLYDDDYLVRCEACTSLQDSNSNLVYTHLLVKINDSNYLVRGYAAISVANMAMRMNKNIQENLKGILLKMLDDSSEWVLIAVLFALVLMGVHDYEKEIFKHLNSHDYKNRSFVLSLLDEMLDRKTIVNLNELTVVLLDCISREKNQSVYEKLNNLYIKCTQFDK